MKSLHDYTIVIRPDGLGAFNANVPAIPGCHAYGKTPEEAQKELGYVFDMIYAEFQEEGRSLPGDCQVETAHAWKQEREMNSLDVQKLRELVQEGVESSPGLDADIVFSQLKEKYQAMANKNNS